jgi:hypothetical protein
MCVYVDERNAKQISQLLVTSWLIQFMTQCIDQQELSTHHACTVASS